MGCDIHVYLENVAGEYVDSVAQFSPGRAYTLFALMAGVRGDGDDALFAPRGVPDNMGWLARSDYVACTDWHSASWLTTAEMEQVKAAYEEKEFSRASWYQSTDNIADRALLPDARPEDITVSLVEEGYRRGMYYVEVGPKLKATFPPSYAALLAAMQALGEGARIVFWFDN